MSSRGSVFALLLVATGGVHCGSAQILTEPVRRSPATPARAPERAATPEPPPAVEPTAKAEVPPDPSMLVANRLAEKWCGEGGDTFLPIGVSQDSDEQYRMRSCDEVARQSTMSVAAGSIIELTVSPSSSEDRRYLHVAGGDEAVLLGHAWSSGVGAFSHFVDATAPASADVYGDAGDEVWTTVTYGWNDTDMGLCRRAGEIHQKLVLCTRDGGSLACLDVPLVDVAYDEIYTEGEGCERPRAKRKGFAMTGEVEKGVVALVPGDGKKGDRLTSPTKPPFVGSVSIAKLLKKAPAKIVRP